MVLGFELGDAFDAEPTSNVPSPKLTYYVSNKSERSVRFVGAKYGVGQGGHPLATARQDSAGQNSEGTPVDG